MCFLTDVSNNIEDGGLEELVRCLLCQPQHALRGPLHYIHTDTCTKRLTLIKTPD